MLTSALLNRSWRGIALGLQPAAWCAVLVLGLAFAGELGPPASGPVLIVLFAGWALVVGERARRRAHAVVAWFPEAIFRHGGNPIRLQPVAAPDFAEMNRPWVSWWIADLEAAQLQYQRAPGVVSRRGLAAFDLAVGGAGVVAFSAAQRFATAAVLAFVVAGGSAMLWTGAGREPGRPWRAASGRWPEAWQIVERPSRVLGLVWIALGLVVVGIVEWSAQAPTVERGLDRGAAGVGVLWFLWEARAQVLRLQRLERVRGYQAMQRLVARSALPLWYLVATLRILFCGLALVAFWAGPVLGGPAIALAATSFGIGVMLGGLPSGWKRPRAPRVVDVQDGAQALAIQAIDRRVTATLRLLALAALVWTLASA
jgi:hypothetical protein